MLMLMSNKRLHCAELPRARLADEVGERLDIVWELVAQPLLFGVAGAAVSFLALPHMAAMKCLAAALIGLALSCKHLTSARNIPGCYIHDAQDLPAVHVTYQILECPCLLLLRML